MTLILIMVVLSFLAGFVQTASGFGAGIIMMIGLPYFMSLPSAAAIAGCACLTLNIMNTQHYFYALKKQTVLVPCIFFVIGDIIAVSIVQDIHTFALKMAFGVFLVALSIYFLRFSDKATVKATPFILVIFGTVSGLCDGFFSIGGPLMVLLYLAITQNKDEYLASIAFSFFIATLTATIMRYFEGILTPEVIKISLIAIVAIQIGRFFGQKVADRINEAQLRTLIYYLIGISGMITVVTTWLQH